MSDAVIVFTTCGSRKEAIEIARATVKEGLAACVQLLPPVRSVYTWQGKLEQSREILLLFKTTMAQFGRLETRIAELHSYETPEILAVPAVAGAAKYLAWLREAVDPA